MAREGAGGLLRRVGFPHPPNAWRLLRSAFFAWLGLRLFLAGSLYLTNGQPWVPPHWSAALLLLSTAVGLTQLDVRIHRESVFYRDLGARVAWAVLLPLIGAGVPEVLADSLLRTT